MERLKVFHDLEKLFCIACKVIFLVLGLGGDDPSLQLVNVKRTCLGHDVLAICICGFYCKSLQVILLASC